MKTGVIVYGLNGSSEGERKVVDRCVEYLRSNGRANVYPGYYFGEPSADKVLYEMFKDGVDTFVLLPTSIAEGKLTVWNMPAKVHLPDNCGSWAIIDGKDIATRFATALGRDPRMAKALVERYWDTPNGTGLLLLSHGSNQSQSAKTAEYFADALRKKGIEVECGYTRFGPAVMDAVNNLRSRGISRIIAVPLMVAVDGVSAKAAVDVLGAEKIRIDPPISEYPEYMEIMDGKVPEGW